MLFISVADPYTGKIYWELYADDLEYFIHLEDSIEAEILKRPLDERREITCSRLCKFKRRATIAYAKPDLKEVSVTLNYNLGTILF